MSKTLNYNNVQKRYLTVTFADEKNTTIMVCMPTKGFLREFSAVSENIDNIGSDDFASLDELYRICAKAMSRNKAGVKITPEFLDEIFDFEDILIFIDSYTEFITEVAGAKN